MKELCNKKLSSSVIAKRLNEEGFRPPKRTDHFSRDMVQRAELEALPRVAGGEHGRKRLNDLLERTSDTPAATAA